MARLIGRVIECFVGGWLNVWLILVLGRCEGLCVGRLMAVGVSRDVGGRWSSVRFRDCDRSRGTGSRVHALVQPLAVRQDAQQLSGRATLLLRSKNGDSDARSVIVRATMSVSGQVSGNN
jgi:hypothetical protein